MESQRKSISIMLEYLEKDIIENPDKLIPIDSLFTSIRNKIVLELGDELKETFFEYLLKENLTEEDLMMFFAEFIDQLDDPENPIDWSKEIDYDLSEEELDLLNKPLSEAFRENISKNRKES